MLQIGQQAPEFSLPGVTAGTIDSHGLHEYTDRGWAVVLVFYPLDFHPACTDQMCSLRDADWLTLVDDVVVLGIGGDSVYAHREYATTHNIQFTLLSDSDGIVSGSYGVMLEDFEGHRAVPDRATIVVGPDRLVRFAWRASGPTDEPDLDAIRAAATADGPPSVPGTGSYDDGPSNS